HSNEFRAVVAAQVRRGTVRSNQLEEHTDDSLSRRAALHINGEAFTGKLIHHCQQAEAVTMNILILNKVVGPNVVGIGRCQWQRTLTALALTFWPLHLQTSTLPQPMDALAIDGAFASQQRPDPSIAVARMCLGERPDLALYP